jgi:ankyrin
MSTTRALLRQRVCVLVLQPSLALVVSVATLNAAPRDGRLIDAVKNGNHATVRVLLREKVDVNASAGDGATALHWAAYRDDPESVDLLIAAGAVLDAVNDLGATPLWVACANGGAAVVERLLTAGATPNIALPTGETPLMTASRANNAAAVKLLLRRGADVNVSERVRGQTALMWAVAQQHAAVAAALIEGGANVHAHSLTWNEVVNVGGDGNVFLTTDVTENPPDAVVMKQGGFTPLLFAARYGDIESAKVLLANGARVNDAAASGATALVLAAHSGHTAFATFLLDHGADPNAADAGYAALHVAVFRGDLPLVKALLAHGANANARLERGTPWRRASQDVALANPVVGATPLWIAATFLNLEITRALAAGGADPTAAKGTATPLIAALQGYRGGGQGRVAARLSAVSGESNTLAVVKVLFDLGADANGATVTGDSAVHLAAAKGFNSVIQLLAGKGADFNVRNRKGQTPLALAADRTTTADLLRHLGARE